MHQFIVLILAALSVAPSLAQADDKFCSEALTAPGPRFEELLAEREQKRQSLELLGQISKLEKKIQARRRFNGDYERQTVLEARRRRNLLAAQLRLGEVNAAIDLYRELFRNTELSFWEIKTKTSQLEALDKELAAHPSDEAASLRDQLSDEIDEAVGTFGRSYGEYVDARSFLEDAAADKSNADLQSNATQVLGNLGIHNLAELLPKLGLDNQRASLEDMQALFRATPDAVIAKLKRDAREEFWTSVKVLSLSYPIVNALKSLVYKLPAQVRDPVSRILGIAYDAYVRDTYLPEIERIQMVENAPRAKLDLLRELNANSPSDELLVTFARLVNGTDTWEELKKQSAELGKSISAYQSFSERMGKAETEAKKLGEVSLFYDSTPATRLAMIGVSSTAVAAWAVHAHSPELQAFLEHLKVLLMHLGH